MFPLNPGVVYRLAYRCRDIGYGIEAGHITAYWTGEVDPWGKLTIKAVDGPVLYLFQDEIVRVRKAVSA